MNIIHESKSIKDIIFFIKQSIKTKEDTLITFQKKYLANTDDIIVINRFALIELLDEFQGIINQSVQAIGILQTEIINLTEQNSKQNIIAKQNGSETVNNKEKENQKEKEKEKEKEGNNNIYHRVKGIKQTLNIKNKHNRLNSTDINSSITLNTKANTNTNTNFKSIDESKKEENSNRKKQSFIFDSISLFGETEPEPEQEKKKTPLIHPGMNTNISVKNIFSQHEHELNVNYTNDMISIETDYAAIPSRSKVLEAKVHQIEKDNKMKSILLKIGNIDKYKSYLSTKYGNGCYGIFIEKLKNNKISTGEIAQEVKIISQEIKNEINKFKAKNRKNSNQTIERKTTNINPYANTTTSTIGNSQSSTENKGVKARLRSESTKRQIKLLNEQILNTFRQIEEL